MLIRFKSYQSHIYSVLIGLFFLLILHVKVSYTLIPILLALSGIIFSIPHIKQKNWQFTAQDKWIIGTFTFYFLLFIISLCIYHGKGKELDLPSRALLSLPILVLLAKIQVKQLWIIYAILSAASVAGLIAIIQVVGLHLEKAFPKMMHIQAGDIAMSLAVFCFCTVFYFYANKQYRLVFLGLIAGLLGIIASFLTTARGAWIGVPVVLMVIFWLNRRNLSKWLVIGVLLITLSGGIFASKTIYQRYQSAQDDISAYLNHSNTSTSVGARFDMWKSAIIGIQEKPIFGWGLEGVKTMRNQHFQEGKISQYAASFGHSHNQYLHDTSTRGLLGLIALLAILFVPLIIFWHNLRQSTAGSLTYLWGVVGISHILLTMSYFLTQAFISHNSGIMFYFVTTIIFLGLQKIAKNQSLTGIK
ncbi:O-antigen ligase family protein [Actinobacillus genomosp. 2]|uniref:O-antigen ligase family protein n=1 Tax=Actinobacillus genomosp. 2 TaxID=230709 RepID=UPI002441B4E7|nr:O-antigen ligase [Actinobacillus genomosp. 2]WGE32247.1 O-antigen ligase family protein [Actinobacillus genomosp. 2]